MQKCDIKNSQEVIGIKNGNKKISWENPQGSHRDRLDCSFVHVRFFSTASVGLYDSSYLHSFVPAYLAYTQHSAFFD